MPEPQRKVFIRRPLLTSGVLRRWNVSIDGELFYLRAGSKIEYAAQSNAINVCAQVDWYKPCCWKVNYQDNSENFVLSIRDGEIFKGLMGEGRRFKLEALDGGGVNVASVAYKVTENRTFPDTGKSAKASIATIALLAAMIVVLAVTPTPAGAWIWLIPIIRVLLVGSLIWNIFMIYGKIRRRQQC